MNVQYLEKQRTGLAENKDECQIISVETSNAEKKKSVFWGSDTDNLLSSYIKDTKLVKSI